MKQRILAFFLIAAMALALSPAAAAASTRDTDFFTPRDHADLDFADMKYEPVDIDAVLEKMDAVRALAADAAALDDVRSGFLAACDDYATTSTMYTLVSIYSSMDYTDAVAAQRQQEALQNVILVQDGLFLLVRDILNSPCAAALDGIVAEEDQKELADYEGLTEDELALSNQESVLENEYWLLAGQDYSAAYGGKIWTDTLAEEAYFIGEISYQDYAAILRAIAKEENAALGAHFLKMAELRKQIAAINGYSDFTDYAYELVYDRDYTKEEIRAFHAAVKEYIAPVNAALQELYYSRPAGEAFYTDYAGDIALDLIEPYVAALSDELYESFRYMRDHGLYDSGWNELKNDQGYTTQLEAYGAPFFFNNPNGGPWDLTTAVHEFGHYNNYYWTDGGWYLGDKPIDICEVHSQALELLFTEFYPQLFGGDANDVEIFLLLNRVNSIISGSLYDELQQYIYGTPGVTLQQINQKYCQLCKEYGVIDSDDERTEMYGWINVPHTFVSPCYYISYAVSSAGAFAFWLDAKDGAFFDAVDKYLRFTALDLSYDFSDSFAAVGIPSPLTKAYLESLAAELMRTLDVLSAPPFTDVGKEDWFYDYVDFAWTNGILSGTSANTFSPDQPMTRAMAVTVLYRLAYDGAYAKPDGSYTDVEVGSWYENAVYWAKKAGLAGGYGDGRFGPDDLITRQDFAVMLYNLIRAEDLGFTGSWYFLLDAPDAGEISDYADEAMHWMVMNHVIGGRDDGTLGPQDYTTRAECAKILTDYISVLLAE